MCYQTDQTITWTEDSSRQGLQLKKLKTEWHICDKHKLTNNGDDDDEKDDDDGNDVVDDDGYDMVNLYDC